MGNWHISLRLLPHFRNALWSVAGQLSNPIALLLTTPILLRELGERQYGLWILVQSPLVASQILSVGASVTLVTEVAANRAKSCDAASATSIRNAIALVMAISVALSFCLLWALPRIPRVSGSGAVGRLLLLGGGGIVLLALTEIDNVYTAALRGIERFDIAAKFEMVTRVLLTAMTLLMAMEFGVAVYIVWMSVFLMAVKVSCKAIVVGRKFCTTKLWWPQWKRSEIKRLTGGGLWQVLLSLSSFVFLGLDRWTVGSLLGAPDLARYSVCLQLAQICHTLPSAAFQMLIPWSSRRFASGSSRPQQPQVLKVALVAAVLCLLFSAVIAFLCGELLRWWISAIFADQNRGLAVTLISAFALLAVTMPSYYMLLGAGAWRYSGLLTATAAGLYVLAMVFVTPKSVFGFAALRTVYGGVMLLSWWKLGKMSFDLPSPKINAAITP